MIAKEAARAPIQKLQSSEARRSQRVCLFWLRVQLRAAWGHQLHFCQQRETIITKPMLIRKCDHRERRWGSAVFIMLSGNMFWALQWQLENPHSIHVLTCKRQSSRAGREDLLIESTEYSQKKPSPYQSIPLSHSRTILWENTSAFPSSSLSCALSF